jgi:MFS family permease
LTISGIAQTWHVFVFAFLLGCATAFDSPTRQTFVAEMVGDDNLSNAVALNSTSFNASRLIGPAAAGLLIAAVGSGWVFMINAASFLGVLSSLACIRKADLNVHERPAGEVFGGLMEGLRYVAGRRDLQTLLAMLLMFGAIGLNFPIYLSTIALVTFKLDARGFGFLTSAMAIGSLGGALLAARRARPTIALIALGAFVFGLAFGLAAIMPTATTFAAMLIVVGACSQTVTTSTTSLIQLSTDPPMRGRVMAILMTVALGGQPLGAPLVGWIANQFGPRCAILVGAASGIATALMGKAYLWRARKAARTGKPSR